MFCPNCGAEIANDAKFCVTCGSPVEVPAVTYNQYSQPVQPALGMKWFKFVIYFSLWAGAVLNIMLGIFSITGFQYDYESGYEGTSDLLYLMFDDLKTVDVIYGVALIALAVYMIIIRFRLAGYYKNGPTMFVSYYVISVLISIAYLIVVMNVRSLDFSDIDVSDLVSSTGTRIVVIITNIIYFKKRKHLFTK